jgi:hypothetical protein
MLELACLVVLAQQAASARNEPLVADLVLEDLGLVVAWSTPEIGGIVLVGVAEVTRGTDLNGDGDLLDVVVHAARVDPAAGSAAVSLGVAGSVGVVDGELAAALGHVPLSVREADQGASDLDGDGDALDDVQHLVEIASLEVASLGLTRAHAVGVLGDLAILAADELLEGRDLDGDGDALDPLVLLHDLGSGTRTVLGPGRPLGLVEGRVVVSEEEWRLGVDLDGDGGLLGERFRAQDPVTGAAAPLGIPGSRSGTRALVGSTLFSSPSEDDLARDLNRDGDSEDVVLHAFEVARGERANLGLPASARTFHVHASRVLGHVPEAPTGRDWNGDGDLSDSLLVEYDPQDLELVPHPMDVDGDLRGAAPEDVVSRLEAEGGVDATGDGDGLDLVPQLYDLASRARSRLSFAGPLALGFPPLVLSAGRLAFLVGEDEQAADLNGDGDRDDAVPRVHTLATGRTDGPALAVGRLEGMQGDAWGLWLSERALVFPVSEAGNARDLDGDGMLDDSVLHVLALGGAARQRLTNLRVGVGRDLGFEPMLRERWIGLPLDEVGAGRDLDGDGFVGFVVVPSFHHVASGATFSLGARGAILAMDEQHALVSMEGVLHRVTLVER